MAFGSSSGGFGMGAGMSPFGQQQQPQSQNSFGYSAFGTMNQNQGGMTTPFGAQNQTNAFGGGARGFGSTGSPNAGGFGASTSSFGSAQPSFASNVGMGTFGAASQPSSGAFGGTGTSSFGSFGGGGFGSSPSAGAFGGQQGASAVGTRGVPYQITQETDSTSSGYGGQTGKYVTITAMPAYRNKSVEELRAEDYKQGVKGGMASGAGGMSSFGSSSAQTGFGGGSTSPFGASPASQAFGAQPSAFGNTMAPAQGGIGLGFGASSSSFGSPGAFGTSNSAFGAGSFGNQASTPAFGGQAASPGGFGSTFPASGNAFGAPSSASAFGAASSTPAFGAKPAAFGSSFSTPSFGAMSAPAAFGGSFGASMPGASASSIGMGNTAGFGGFGAAASRPAFGFNSAAGAMGASSPSIFGATSTGAFGTGLAPAPTMGTPGMPTPSFGATPGIFGAASASAFGAPSSASFSPLGSAPAMGSFGAASSSLFGGLSASKPLMSSPSFAPQGAMGLNPAQPFGAQTSGFATGMASFGSSPSLFSGTTSPSIGTSTFGTPTLSTTFGAPNMASSTPSTQTVQVNSASPYGVLPQLPAQKDTNRNDIKAGITPPVGRASPGGIASTSRMPHTMLTPRLITPRSAMRMRPRRVSPGLTSSPVTSLNGYSSPQQRFQTSLDSREKKKTIKDDELVPRENPRKLFVRDPLASPISSKLSLPDSMKSSTPFTSSAPSSSIRKPNTTTSKYGAISNGVSPINHSASKELTFLSPDIAAHDKSQGTPVMLSNTSVSKVNMSMPTLQNREYYIEPSLHDLLNWTKSDPTYLEAVPNFIVGRQGYGQIKFQSPVDLRDCQIDQVVQFGDKEVRVYMDGSFKPTPGSGLNQPAQITLFNVHKIDKVTSKVIKDKAKIDAFIQKLKARAEAQGAKFISYQQEASSRNPKGGEYTFEVDHFSKYDCFIDDSDDEEELDDIVTKNKISYSDSRNLVQAMAIDAKVDAAEVFELKNNQTLTVENDKSPTAQVLKHSWKSNSPLLPKVTEAMTKSIDSSVRKDLNFEDIYSQNMINVCQVESVGMKNSCISKSNGSIIDISAMLGRSFRVGWGPSGKFGHSGFWSFSSHNRKQNASTIHVEKLTPGQRGIKSLDARAPALEGKNSFSKFNHQYLETHSKYTSQIEPMSEDRGCFFMSSPYDSADMEIGRKSLSITTENLSTICNSYCKMIADFQDLEVTSNDKARNIVFEHFKSIWELVLNVFKDLDQSEHHSEEEMNIIRRKLVSDWLEKYASWRVREDELTLDKAIHDLDSIILNLSKHDLSRASEIAISAKNVRLASLIAYAGTCGYLKEDLFAQLDTWEEEGHLDFIPEKLKLLYELLSGNVKNLLAQYNFDWRRSLGIIMWYEQSPLNSVEESIASFKSILSDNLIEEANPMYMEFQGENIKSNTTDTCLEILKFLCSDDRVDVASLLRVSGYSPDTLDYATSWHLLTLLESMGILNFQELSPSEQESVLKVHFSYLSELEFLGLSPEWLVYTALHLPSGHNFSKAREITVCNILMRTVPQWHDDERIKTFFIEKAHVPYSWMHGAQALWEKYNHHSEAEFYHLLNAGAQNEAQKLFSIHFGSEMFLNEFKAVSHALAPLPFETFKEKIASLAIKEEHANRTYSVYISIYKAFFDLIESGHKGSISEEAVAVEYANFARTIKNIVTSTVENQAVLTKMCSIFSETLQQLRTSVQPSFNKVAECMQFSKACYLPPENTLKQLEDASLTLSILLS